MQTDLHTFYLRTSKWSPPTTEVAKFTQSFIVVNR